MWYVAESLGQVGYTLRSLFLVGSRSSDHAVQWFALQRVNQKLN
jgi:hypothetical protein